MSAETTRQSGNSTRNAAVASSEQRSDLLNTMSLGGRGSTRISSSTWSTAAMWRRKSASEASVTCSRRSASIASTSVLWNEATRWCGSLRMKPTVSVTSATWRSGLTSWRVVESSVANSRSSTNTPALVSALNSVLLPALV